MNAPAYEELLQFRGKVALVTGASGGIGAGIARRFAHAGAMVAVHYHRNQAAAQALVSSIRQAGFDAIAVQANLAGAAGAARLIDEVITACDRLDVCINNAGSFPNRPLLDISETEWHEMYRSNVDSCFFCLQAAARYLRSAGGGAIVNVASIAALAPGPDHSHYNSAKAAVVMLTRSAAQELGRYNIRVNAVSPGLIARPGIEQQWPEGVARWQAGAPLERLGEPEDVADACLFLASPAARWITGHNLIVDGGVMSSQVY